MAHGRKTGGRQAGTPNKITAQFKEAVRTVYEDIGGDKAFADFARANPFYTICSRLLPGEISAQNGTGVTVIIAPRDSDGRLIIDADYEQVPQLN